MVYIRPATLQDAAAIADLGRRTFFDTFAADNDPADMQIYLEEAYSFDAIYAQLADSDCVFLLAQATAAPDAVPLGYAQLIERSPVPDVATPHPIELARLYVDHSAIGRGYGARLMQACLAYAAAHQFETLWLGVWEKNLRAQRFYARWGFQKVGVQLFCLGKDQQTDYVLLRSVTTVEPLGDG